MQVTPFHLLPIVLFAIPVLGIGTVATPTGVFTENDVQQNEEPKPSCKEVRGWLQCRDELTDQKTMEDSAKLLWVFSRNIREDEDDHDAYIKKQRAKRCAEADASKCDSRRKGVQSVEAEITPSIDARVDWTRLQKYAVAIAVMKNEKGKGTERGYGLERQEWIPERRTILVVHPGTNKDTTRWTAFQVRQSGLNPFDRSYSIEGRKAGYFVACESEKQEHKGKVVADWTGCNGKRAAMAAIAERTGRPVASITHEEAADYRILGNNTPFVDPAWITCANGCCEFQY